MVKLPFVNILSFMKYRSYLLMVVLAGMLISGGRPAPAYASVDNPSLGLDKGVSNQSTQPTLIPTVTPSIILAETPPDRVLPPVGSNYLLDLGAIVIVLIIIGGVLGIRGRQKH